MCQESEKTILLVDYENIHHVDFSVLPEQEIDIKIFVGQAQHKVPIELVQSVQRFGQSAEWIKITGMGKNALDFHIAFYLGKFSQDSSVNAFFILSKDKGFDPLIQHLNHLDIHCQRILNLQELPEHPISQMSQTTNHLTSILEKVIEDLEKIPKNKRPRKRTTLCQYIESFLTKTQLGDNEIDTLVDKLLTENRISEHNNRLIYHF